MTTGRDPGELGLYGFRNRVPGTYDLVLPTSRDVRVKRVWDLLGEHGRRVAALFVPLTFPPTPVRGHLVSCFMTPGPEHDHTFPRNLGSALAERFGEHIADVHDYRTSDGRRVLREVRAMAQQHFDVAHWMWTEHRPDFLMMVEMGPDRLHHAMFHHLDPTHPRHAPDHPLVDEAREYYAYLDRRIGELVAATDEETAVLVVSDHGARPMEGGFRTNEWLRREGWLSLRDVPTSAKPVEPAAIDWAGTRAWAEGGYYARIFLNLTGREPDGTVPARERERARRELAIALQRIHRPDGRPLGADIVFPEDTFRLTRGAPPDLMVFLGDLALRSVGTVGGDEGLFVEANDTGPDACNHDWDGIFVMAGGGCPAHGRLDGLDILDVTPTVLSLMGVPVPTAMRGRDVTRA
jgi:predicted AlkP superfamily phosphohydrolase/phosphomutase